MTHVPSTARDASYGYDAHHKSGVGWSKSILRRRPLAACGPVTRRSAADPCPKQAVPTYRRRFRRSWEGCGPEHTIPKTDIRSRTRWKKGPTGIAGGSSYAPVRLCYQQRPGRRITIWHLHFCYLRPVNGLPVKGILNWSPSLSSSNWCLIYSWIFFVFFPVVST